MKKNIIVIGLLITCCLFVASIAQAAGKDGLKGFEIGVAFDFKKVVPKQEIIPEEVRREAANPSIVNPHSGHYFDKDTIGTYDPYDKFSFCDLGIFVKYTVPLDFFIKPYLRTEILYPLDASTHKGSYGEGYTYAKVLGGGVDYVRYVYGIEYSYKYWMQPEIGLIYIKEGSFSLSVGVGFQALKLTYKKGIEAWGKPDDYEVLASSEYTLYNYKATFTKFIDKESTFSIGPIITRTAGDKIAGWGLGFSFQALF